MPMCIDKRILAGLLTAFLCAPSVAQQRHDEHLPQARALTKQLATSLQQTLATTLKADGPVAAIKVCNTAAPEISRALSRQGWQVGRVSQRLRNTDNAPDEWERATLLRFEQQLAAGQDATTLEHGEQVDGRFRYMKAIATQAVCLTCHGTVLSTAVQQAIAQRYPLDRATGYDIGQLRGAFSLSKVMEE
ncbi:glutamate synthase [Bacterioplanes sanyensis]|uniref:Glutamate synthase n=1 Tax=Bacterioplanes sanyensis TaxID=1249553 RepID=A0A222FGW3_9GAMM|nr:DUF3365 domain-containing protein [Bacterioplanes sanyensis]ASP38295.1 glutamate synthase [Bacterioplanes sanyensis]